MDGSISQVIRICIKFCDVYGLLHVLSGPKCHLSIVSFLDPFGNNLEASPDRDERVDSPVILLETFWSIQIDCPFCLSEALHKVFDEDLLALHGNLKVSDASVRLSLRMSDVIDKAIDDLSMCG